ncbi:MAG: hypothetical protein ACXVEE_41645 [Polyangiales bacterium]
MLSLRVSGSITTALFWASVGLFVAAFWIAPFPPSVDLPQHVAIGAVLHRLMLPGAPERALYEITPVTYNALFDLLVALLSFVMRPETAGRLLISLVPVLNAIAMLALVRATDRPAWYACLAIPASYGYSLAYGFVNYALGVPIALLTYVAWLRRRDLWVVLGALVCALAHPFAVLCLLFSAAITLRSFRRAAALLPFAPAVIWVLVARGAHLRSPDATSLAASNGYDIAAWRKLEDVATHVLGDVSGRADEVVFLVALALIVALWLARAPSDERTAPVAKAWLVAYLVMPTVFMAAWAMFQRTSPWWLAFSVAAAPRARGRWVPVVRSIAVACALSSGAITMWRFSKLEGTDAREVLAAVPRDAKVASLIFSWTGAPAVEKPIWIHYAAYALAAKPVELGRSFARDYGDFVIRERSWRDKPRPSEWEPTKYDVDSAFGRRYTTVFVRTADDADPTLHIFGKHPVRVLAHRGRFWLFDTSP